ncbi:hypothetical protein [Cypionkella psychrotolerans]|uniref:hypothetical protein n=1 Tax=Cypionkella psychrotolerans TaxID=1678131 RepID=UPI000ABFF5F7|nr:hypothetical protein [Cypionkella psychrotolerans]
MSAQNKTNATNPSEQGSPPPDYPVESGKKILINWIIVALGLGGLAAAGALLPELL